MSHDLKEKAVTGVMWNTVARIGQQVMQLGLTAILARLLLPDDFGAVGMIVVVITFLGMFLEAGFTAALVQRTHISELHTDSVFWFTVGAGLVLSGLLFACAPLVAAFYREPILVPMTRGLSPTFLVAAVGHVPEALMYRRLQFHLTARFSLVATFVSGTTGVALALLGAGVWSLVAMYLGNYMVFSVLNLIFSGLRPQRRFRWDSLKELWGFTGNVLAFNFTNYWARNADNMLIGRFLGSEALGYYSRAYGLMLAPISQVISVIASVMFAALSTIKEDRARVKSIFLRAIGLITLLVFPMMTGLLIVAEPFVLTVFGEKWADMIPTVRILALVGAIQSLSHPTGWIYLSQGRTDWYFRVGLVNATLIIIAIAAGIAFGSIEAVALLYAVTNLLMLYPNLAIPGRLVGMRFGEIFRTVSAAIVDSVLMGLTVYGMGWLLPDGLPHWQELGLLVATGVLVYGALTVGLRRTAWLNLVGLVRERMGGRAHSTAVPGLQE